MESKEIPSEPPQRPITLEEALTLERKEYVRATYRDLYERLFMPRLDRVSPPLTDDQDKAIVDYLAFNRNGAEYLAMEAVESKHKARLFKSDVVLLVRNTSRIGSAILQHVRDEILSEAQRASYEATSRRQK